MATNVAKGEFWLVAVFLASFVGCNRLRDCWNTGMDRVAVDFGAGQGASAAPISAAISAQRATSASAKIGATLRAHVRRAAGRVARSLQPAAGMRLARSLPSTPSASTRGLLQYSN